MNFSSTDEYSNIVNSSSFKLLSDKRQNEILNNIKASELKAKQEFKKDNPNSLLDKIKKSPELMGFAAGSILGVGSGIKIVKKAKSDLSKSFLNLFAAKNKRNSFNLGSSKVETMFTEKLLSRVKINKDLIIPENKANHMFADRPGHLTDNLFNRELLLKVASMPKKGVDIHGNSWHSFAKKDGSQIWVQVRGNKITNGGINNPAKTWSEKTGYSSVAKPKQKNNL